MANLKELRLRIASVKNTRKITAAMSQIASARLRRAQNAAMAARPYGERMEEVVQELVAGIPESERAEAHPLLRPTPDAKRTLFVVMTADKGLCGGFNGNINRTMARRVIEERAAGREVTLLLVGKKAAAFFKREKNTLDRLPAPKEVARRGIDAFLSKEPGQSVDRVILYYNHFVSVLTQRVTEKQLVPLLPAGKTEVRREPTFEPSREAILKHLVPVAIESVLQQAMFNSVAAEIAARRVAMDSATDNASELIADLTLEYNRERQAAITKELMEIVGGAEALKG
jgi:F-type H+-transporting ATPase subunit gamma